MEPYIGQIKQLAFNWAPQDYALCNGAVIAYSANPALGSLLGNQFGGSGNTSFNLPNLQGRTPVHPSYPNYIQGIATGVETVTITEATMARHTHDFMADQSIGDSFAAEDFTDPTQHKVFAEAVLYGTTTPADLYGQSTNLVTMNPATSTIIGGGQAHGNMQPSSVINYVIALTGVYPSRS